VLLPEDTAMATEEMRASSATKFLQIVEVKPEPDRSFPIFQSPSVPAPIREYYEHNGTNVFSFQVPVVRPQNDGDYVQNEALQRYYSTWTEKTLLVCTDAFPSVIKRTQVEEIRTILVSPLESAIEDLQTQSQELRALEHKFSDQSDQGPVNILAAKLNEALDPEPQQGVPFYRKGTCIVLRRRANADRL
jgi:dedicator of cytokinesis protein 3